uniref:Uncharacterized protein n=1 Tax=Oryza sativa subsp. japonica TaxID=39947 RepID=Q6K4W0_ORYSJ|nr:hypothetical protein [Oryza sativa Japonica Group]
MAVQRGKVAESAESRLVYSLDPEKFPLLYGHLDLVGMMTSSGTSRGSVSSSWVEGREPGRMQPPVPYREGPLDYELPVFCDCKVKAARNAVWTAREEINGLKAHLQDNRDEALKNRAVSRSKESNELESLRAALEQIEATNCFS